MFESKESWNEYLKAWSRLFHTFGTAAIIALAGYLLSESGEISGLAGFLSLLALIAGVLLLYLNFWVLNHMRGDE